MPVQFLACIALVSTYYQLPPRVLPSIQAVEGGRPGLISPNADGSADLGVMQINTRWITPLARHTGQPESMVRQRLIDEPCFNIAVAGAIIRIHLNEEGGNLLRAVGDYHSRTPERNQAYQAKVLQAAEALFRSRPLPAQPHR
jgi:soluble lytic murein transglycosylase-like protein